MPALYPERPPRYNPQVEFRILGPLQVFDGESELPLGSPKERVMLAVLLLHANKIVSRDRLIDELWGASPPPTAAKALNVHVSQLRKTLAQNGHGWIATRPPGYVIEVEPERLDSARFERLVATARERLAAGDLQNARGLLREALALWRGPALDGIELEATRTEVARLEQLRLAAATDRIDCDLELGQHEQLIGELEALVAAHPLVERLRGQLILALYRSGRQADALRAYREARQTLVGELGIEPSPPLQRLEKAILNQDPSLEAPGGTVRAGSPRPRRRRLLLGAIAFFLALAVAALAAVVMRRDASAALSTIPPNSIAIIDPQRNAAVADIPLHTRPAALAYGAGSLWVATKDDHTLLRIDPRSHRITQTVGLGVEPTAVAAAGRSVWVLGREKLFQFDGGTGTLVRTIALRGTIHVGPFKGRGLPRLGVGLAPDPFELAAGAGAAWIAYGYGVVARIDARTGTAEQISAGSSHGIAFGKRAAWALSGAFLAPTADAGPLNGTISRIDARTRAVTEIPPPKVGADPDSYGLAAGPAGVWTISENSKRAWRVDPDVARVTAVIPLAHAPADIAVGPEAVWTVNDDATVSRIDDRAAAVVRTIPLGRYPRLAYPVDVTTGEGAVWVAVR